MGLGLVQVLQIRAFPEEALARRPLNAARVDPVRVENRLLLRPKILAHDRDHAHISEEAGRQREIRCRAAQAAIPSPRRGFNGIERHAAYYSNCHSYELLTFLRGITPFELRDMRLTPSIAI